ncbi:hypothetical protein TNCV_1964731 [Trichonephila clavipes]|nr:hypothetical protein TNCV_1964731 [Trichonephila clavipes]
MRKSDEEIHNLLPDDEYEQGVVECEKYEDNTKLTIFLARKKIQEGPKQFEGPLADLKVEGPLTTLKVEGSLKVEGPLTALKVEGPLTALKVKGQALKVEGPLTALKVQL